MRFWKDKDIQALLRKSDPASSAEQITTAISTLLRQDIETTMRENPTLLGSGPRIVFPVEKSVQDDKIVCLFDGIPCNFIKKHLIMRYGMRWAEYLEYCGLPSDYPHTPPLAERLRKEKIQTGVAKKGGSTAHPEVIARARRPRPGK